MGTRAPVCARLTASLILKFPCIPIVDGRIVPERQAPCGIVRTLFIAGVLTALIRILDQAQQQAPHGTK
jgi:hypothetical protein